MQRAHIVCVDAPRPGTEKGRDNERHFTAIVDPPEARTKAGSDERSDGTRPRCRLCRDDEHRLGGCTSSAAVEHTVRHHRLSSVGHARHCVHDGGRHWSRRSEPSAGRSLRRHHGAQRPHHRGAGRDHRHSPRQRVDLGGALRPSPGSVRNPRQPRCDHRSSDNRHGPCRHPEATDHL